MRRAVLLAIFVSVSVAAPAQAATLNVSPSGSDSGSCTSAFPCQSLGRAYAVAASGDIVSVAAGTYPRQSVPSGTKFVTFRGTSGTVVRQLFNDASNVTYDSINVDAGGVHTTGAAFELSGNGVTVRNAAVGNVVDEKAMLASGTNQTIDNVVFHDAILRTDGVHMECLYAIGVQGFTLRNSVFRDCAVMDVLFTYGTWWSPKPPAYGNVTVENNVFAHPERTNNGGWHFYSMYVGDTGPNGSNGDPMRGWIVRNNTFEISAAISSNGGTNGTRWVGNVGSWDCKSGITYRYNVGKSCSSLDKAVSPSSSSASQTAPFGWNNPAAYDFHLKSGSPAINAGDPNDAPARDRDGNARSGAPDAGAYEYGGTTTPGPTPTPTPTPTATPTPTPSPSPSPPPPQGDRQPPSVPQGMAWTTITETSIGLRWNASSDNVGVTGYRIYRDGTRVGTTGASARSYTVSGLKCGTRYTIALTAIDAAGNESYAPEATGTTSTKACSTADTQPPSVPQGMAWTTITRTSIGLKWNASTDNVGVTGYRIYRDGTRVTTTDGAARSYTVSGLKCGTRYTISLTAIDAAGNESYAPEARGTTSTKPCAATAPTSGAVAPRPALPATPDTGPVGLGILGL